MMEQGNQVKEYFDVVLGFASITIGFFRDAREKGWKVFLECCPIWLSKPQN